MRFEAEGHNRINVQNDPVNLIDPWGLYDWASEAKGQALTVVSTVAIEHIKNIAVKETLSYGLAPLSDLIFPNSIAEDVNYVDPVWINKLEDIEQQKIWEHLNSPEVKKLMDKLEEQQRRNDERMNNNGCP